MAVTKSSKQVPVKKTDRLIERMADTGDHLAVLHLDHYTTYLEIDGVALEFWKLIDNKKTLIDITEKLQKRYPSETKELPKRTAAWAQALKKSRLLV